jgi:hypothetical protein
MLTENVPGNYTFIPGIGPFSSGVVAHPGFEIVHAVLKPFIPLEQGYLLVDRHLKDLRRTIGALCGMHLRIPKALSREAFDQFNVPYVDRLKSWGLHVDGANPVTRTNVALEFNPVTAPMLAGFFYTIPSDGRAATFVISGAPEISSRDLGIAHIVARGDTSADGMRQKAECVIQVLGARLAEMSLSWQDATAINLYTIHDGHPLMVSTLIPALGGASQAGITWHYARPPVTGLELEIDLHAVRRELIVTS